MMEGEKKVKNASLNEFGPMQLLRKEVISIEKLRQDDLSIHISLEEVRVRVFCLLHCQKVLGNIGQKSGQKQVIGT
jgi:hypothetical protein